MNNPKTTIAGYLVLLAAVVTVAAHFMSGGLTNADWSALVAALTGAGLIGASDGGH